MEIDPKDLKTDEICNLSRARPYTERNAVLLKSF